jgi:hypothetical protein
MEDPTLQTSILSKPPKRSKFLFFFIAGIVVILMGFGGWQFFSVNTESTEEQEATPTPTEFKIPTDTPTPEVTQEPEPTDAPSPTPTFTPKPTSDPVDKSTGLDRSELSVEVQNGSGAEGVAGKASDFLKSLGYDIIAAGNADNFDYENTTIQVKSSMSEYLSLLEKDLGDTYIIGSTSADLPSSSSADALVIIGK